MNTFAWRGIALALAAGGPLVLTCALALAASDVDALGLTTIVVLLASWWAWTMLRLYRHLDGRIRVLANLLGAVRSGDVSTRIRAEARGDDPLESAIAEANALADVLRTHRQDSVEASTLLRKVMQEAGVAILSFDGGNRLHLANPAAEAILKRSIERARGVTAQELGFAACLAGPTPRLLPPGFAGNDGRWELRRASFRLDGRPQQLLVLTDLARPLGEQEHEAWRRLVRVLSHEINNSLAPIASIADSLERRVPSDGTVMQAEWFRDLHRGLQVIRQRAEALGRFIRAHAQLARLPQPVLCRVSVRQWVERVCALEAGGNVAIEPGPDVELDADSDQLDQMLINLVRNAVEAASETGGRVRVGWSCGASELEIWVEDEGAGTLDPRNLFVPFFTTKRGGSGIGLALVRQIAHAHRGTASLENRSDTSGCLARVRLPLHA